VADTLERLSFAPGPLVKRKNLLTMDLGHCPFRIDPSDPDGALVCAFHEGLIRGVAEASGGDVGVRVLPFVEPGVCRVELRSNATRAKNPAAVKTPRTRTPRPPV
jgi:hypothetical protein